MKAKDHFEDTGTDGGVLTKMEEQEFVGIHKGALRGMGRATKSGGGDFLD
jgi:hypothetical protein